MDKENIVNSSQSDNESTLDLNVTKSDTIETHAVMSSQIKRLEKDMIKRKKRDKMALILLATLCIEAAFLAYYVDIWS